MTKIITVICAALSGLITTLFYCLIKEKQKQIDEELKEIDSLTKSGEKYKYEKHEMDEAIASMGNDGSGNNFNNSLSFLQKLHKKGKHRFK